MREAEAHLLGQREIYRSEVLQYACAEMGITLIHTQPYDPQSKGKIERFFRTVQTRFYPLLELDPPKSLEELNERFWRWLEEEYHRKPHASLDGKTPHEVFQSQVHLVLFIEDGDWLDAIFLKREHHKVKADIHRRRDGFLPWSGLGIRRGTEVPQGRSLPPNPAGDRAIVS
ncbi:hypothetical protein B4110_3887 [Parageobacillus toebii]|uniref:Integrase catalytic domain-containing protein n=1 Tax=Parageobacillus toebii TaxID=153151 RepID=A0A150M8D3_9BACL|nr:hypothetical protein B4110_3887 [Parageobacillus toebii]